MSAFLLWCPGFLECVCGDDTKWTSQDSGVTLGDAVLTDLMLITNQTNRTNEANTNQTLQRKDDKAK
jgi:hypothetical protein